MGIGASIFFIALGLILALAVDVQVAGLDIRTIGWILTALGLVGLLLTLYLLSHRRSAAAPPAAGAGYVEERRVYDDRI